MSLTLLYRDTSRTVPLAPLGLECPVVSAMKKKGVRAVRPKRLYIPLACQRPMTLPSGSLK